MIKILEWFYDAWEYIVAIGTVIGIISGLMVFLPKSKKKYDDSGNIYFGEQNNVIKHLSYLLFVVAVVITCISCIAALAFTKVPYVVNKTMQEASATLEKEKLHLIPPNNMQRDAETDLLTVTSQNFEEGAFVLKGTNVSVTLDKRNASAAFVSVPGVVGEKFLDAIDLLIDRGLLYNTTTVGDTVGPTEKATVIGQSIAEDSRVPAGTIIDLELSFDDIVVDPPVVEGDMVVVPDVVDMEQAEAENMLKSRGLVPFVWWSSGTDSDLDTYYIIDQSIPAGSTVPKGTEIQLERSGVKLGTPVVVPNVVGMEQIEATEYIVSLGLQFQVWWTEENNVSAEHYYIIDQSIPEGSTVPAGTLIRLELSVTGP